MRQEICEKCETMVLLYYPGMEVDTGDPDEDVEGAEVESGILVDVEDDGELSVGEEEAEGGGRRRKTAFLRALLPGPGCDHGTLSRWLVSWTYCRRCRSS